MKKINLTLVDLMSALLVLLWTYAALVKLIDPVTSLSQMRNQVFPNWLATILSVLVPITELMVSLLLMSSKHRIKGYQLSVVLLFLFCAYILLVKLMVFSRIPCSCGGIISKFSWTQHLLFNLFFLVISIIGLLFTQKERRWRGRAT